MPDKSIETLDSTQAKANKEGKTLDKREQLKTEVETNKEKFDATYEQMAEVLGPEATNYYYEVIFPQTTALKYDLEAAIGGTPEELGTTFNAFAAHMAKLKKQLKNDLPSLDKKQREFILQLTMETSGFYKFQEHLAALEKEQQHNFLEYLIPFWGSWLDWKEDRKLMAIVFLGVDIIGVGALFATGGASAAVSTSARVAGKAAVSAGARTAAKGSAKAVGKAAAREGAAKGLAKGSKILRSGAKAENAVEGLRLIADLSKEGSRLGKGSAKFAQIIDTNARMVDSGIDAAKFLRDRQTDKKEKAAEFASDLSNKANKFAA